MWRKEKSFTTEIFFTFIDLFNKRQENLDKWLVATSSKGTPTGQLFAFGWMRLWPLGIAAVFTVAMESLKSAGAISISSTDSLPVHTPYDYREDYVFPTHRLKTTPDDPSKIPLVLVACGSCIPPLPTP